ncbi:hypothetical protein RIF29_32998 [Crotalaria pallida]|uniref:Uncharacterized protein n=1 Tax=Crotalaria pallida TaxID=3830 RepID=A0AAN9E7V2_CROPI
MADILRGNVSVVYFMNLSSCVLLLSDSKGLCIWGAELGRVWAQGDEHWLHGDCRDSKFETVELVMAGECVECDGGHIVGEGEKLGGGGFHEVRVDKCNWDQGIFGA